MEVPSKPRCQGMDLFQERYVSKKGSMGFAMSAQSLGPHEFEAAADFNLGFGMPYTLFMNRRKAALSHH